MAIKFGDRFELIVSPLIILKVEGMLEEWVTELASTQGEIDLERESISMAQKLINALALHAQQREET